MQQKIKLFSAKSLFFRCLDQSFFWVFKSSWTQFIQKVICNLQKVYNCENYCLYIVFANRFLIFLFGCFFFVMWCLIRKLAEPITWIDKNLVLKLSMLRNKNYCIFLLKIFVNNYLNKQHVNWMLFANVLFLSVSNRKKKILMRFS